MRLGREVLQEQGVHGALQADVEFVDLAFGQGDDHYAGELKVLEQRRDVGLVPAHPVQGFRHDDVERARAGIRQQRLDARAQDHAVAGDGRIAVGVHDRPACPLRVLPADPELVLDRGRALKVRGVAGVEGGADHVIAPVGLRSP